MNCSSEVTFSFTVPSLNVGENSSFAEHVNNTSLYPANDSVGHQLRWSSFKDNSSSSAA